MTVNSRRWDWHCLLLLALTFLINVPILSPTLLFSQDTLHAFAVFHFFYADLVLNHELARWIPNMGYGMVFDVSLINAILPTDHVMMAIGWLCGIRDSLLLYKGSMILCQAFLVLGLYLLSRRCFTSMVSVWLVCLGGLLTRSWMYSSPWGLTSYYLLPLVLWLVLHFIDTKKAAYLWLAGLVEGLSLLGTIPYIAPLHLFIVTAFLIPFLCRQPGLFWDFACWRNFIHPLFALVCGYYVLVYLWVAGIDVAWTAPGRDPATGLVPLNCFLGQDPTVAWREPLGVFLRILVRSDLYYCISASSAGILTLPAVIYALLRRRDTLFLSFATIAFALFWFSLGGWFCRLTYDFFPLMKTYRYISQVWIFLRLDLMLLAGFGIDQLLRDLRGLPVPPPQALSRRASWVIVIALAACALDHAFNSDLAYWTSTGFYQDGKSDQEVFERQAASIDYFDRFSAVRFHNAIVDLDRRIQALTRGANLGRSANDAEITVLLAAKERLLQESQVLLTVRYAVYLAALAFLWWALGSVRLVRCRATLVGSVLLGAFLADTGFYYSQVLRTAPWCPPGAEPGDAFHIREMTYQPQRYLLRAMPENADAILKIIAARRGGLPGHDYMASAYILMQAEPVVNDGRLDLVMPSIRSMMEARKRPGQNTLISLVLDEPWQRSAGLGLDKARMIRERDVQYAGDERQAFADFKALKRPDERIVIQGAPIAGRAQEADGTEPAGRVKQVGQFSANRVEFELPAGATGWLFYADAYDPAWKASIDGKETQVYRANVGFKAVHVPAGASRVAFCYDGGWRDRHFLAIVLSATLLTFALTAFLLAAPWLLRASATTTVSEETARPASSTLAKVRGWLAFCTLAFLAAALFMMIRWSLAIVAMVSLAGLVMLILQKRAWPTVVDPKQHAGVRSP